MSYTLKVELPESVFFRTVNGKAVNLDLTAIPASVIAALVVGGVKIISTNTFNSGGKDNPEADRLAQVLKRWDAWKRGEYVMVERGETQFTAMKEAFIAYMIGEHQMTTSAVDKLIKAKVEERLPKDSKATFSNFLDATALEYVEAGQFDDAASAREALEAHWTAKADEAAKARAKASDKIVVPMLDLSAFKK